MVGHVPTLIGGKGGSRKGNDELVIPYFRGVQVILLSGFNTR